MCSDGGANEAVTVPEWLGDVLQANYSKSIGELTLHDLELGDLQRVKNIRDQNTLMAGYYEKHFGLLHKMVQRLMDKKDRDFDVYEVELARMLGGDEGNVTLMMHNVVVEDNVTLHHAAASNAQQYIKYVLDPAFLSQGIETVLAFVCLLSATSHGFSDAEIEQLKVGLQSYYGFRSSLALSVLEGMKLLKRRSPGFHWSSPPWQNILSTFDLVSPSKEEYFADCRYNNRTPYGDIPTLIPLVQRLVEYALHDDWEEASRKLSSLPGPEAVRNIPTYEFGGSEILPPPPPGYDCDANGPYTAPEGATMVVLTGGCTWDHIAALRRVHRDQDDMRAAAGDEPAPPLLIFTTNIFTPTSLMSSMAVNWAHCT